MVRKLEDIYYYSSITILMLFVLCFFVMKAVTADDPEKQWKQTMAPFEKIEESESTFLYSFREFPVEQSNGSLVFMTKYQTVEVYADDEQIYLLEGQSTSFGNTVGTRWNFVDIPEDTKMVKVKITNIYEGMKNAGTIFYYGNDNVLYSGLLKDSFWSAFQSVLHVIVGICMVAFWLLINNKAPINRSLVFLGMFALCAGLWSFIENDISTMILENKAIVSFATVVLLMFMLMPFTSFIRELFQTKDVIGWCVIFIYSVVNLVTSLTLQAFQIRDMREMMPWVRLGFIMLAVYIIYSIILDVKRHKITSKFLVNVLSVFALILFSGIGFVRDASESAASGQFEKTGFTVYLILMGAMASSTALKQMVEGKKIAYYKEMARVDMLTGFHNRNSYISDVGIESDMQEVAVAMFDLNDLKKTNDSLGHSKGDQYIKDSAELLSEVFGSYGKCYRVGGDEFCVILRNLSEERVKSLLKELKQKQEEYNQKSRDIRMEIASGYAFYQPDKDADLEATRNRADTNMYQNKFMIKQGQN